MDETVVVDPHRCPLCGEPNQCAVARNQTPCWCFREGVPADVRARIPLEAQDKACVCRACATGKPDPNAAFRRADELIKRRR